MAKFITNTTGTNAIRKDDIVALEIVGKAEASFELVVQLSRGWRYDVIFETATTLEAIQAKAANILVELEG